MHVTLRLMIIKNIEREHQANGDGFEFFSVSMCWLGFFFSVRL